MRHSFYEIGYTVNEFCYYSDEEVAGGAGSVGIEWVVGVLSGGNVGA